MSDSSPCRSDCEGATVELTSWSESELGSLVNDLVEGRIDVVAELDLGDGGVADCCDADREADDALFWERGVEDTVNTVFLGETARATEDSSEFDILAEEFSAGL
jgi:hypothetical protein